MAKDNFPTLNALGSATDGYAVTPDDEADLDPVPRALWVGGGGDVAVTLPSGDVTLKNVPDGTLLPVRALRVLEASTATEIVALV